MIDVIYVTYNSEKWIRNCFQSWLSVSYNLKNINIFIVDNHSTDQTVYRIEEIKQELGSQFAAFSFISEKKNHGFGKANNIGFARGTSDIVCFFNIDTELCEDTIKNLEYAINLSPDSVALWELRQFPYEHPKLYDPLTGETTWSSGAAFAVKRSVFEKLKGFDEKIFMYAEDVDLSWRLRSHGYQLRYVPRAVIRHYAYKSAGEIKPNQYCNSIINNLLLRCRYGSLKTILEGNAMVFQCVLGPEAFAGSRRQLLKAYLRHFVQVPHFFGRKQVGKAKNFTPVFLGFDYAPIRDGTFYHNEFPRERPLVSILVRTCGRPSVLRETLCSLRNQTYSNLEIVIVEDGAPVSESMIRKEFGDLNIVYRASGEKIGRSKAGNLGLSLAKGKYVNFLDDDDLFYADHVEVLVCALLQGNCRAAYAFGFETPIEVKSQTPYSYEVKNYLGTYKKKYNKIELCHHNYIPIQCMMFERSLFEEYGGMDESTDALEDWDLWVRYSLHTDFKCVEKTTSLYRVPYNRQTSIKRQKELDDALLFMREKHKLYQQKISVWDVAKLYEGGMR